LFFFFSRLICRQNVRRQRGFPPRWSLLHEPQKTFVPFFFFSSGEKSDLDFSASLVLGGEKPFFSSFGRVRLFSPLVLIRGGLESPPSLPPPLCLGASEFFLSFPGRGCPARRLDPFFSLNMLARFGTASPFFFYPPLATAWSYLLLLFSIASDGFGLPVPGFPPSFPLLRQPQFFLFFFFLLPRGLMTTRPAEHAFPLFFFSSPLIDGFEFNPAATLPTVQQGTWAMFQSRWREDDFFFSRSSVRQTSAAEPLRNALLLFSFFFLESN